MVFYSILSVKDMLATCPIFGATDAINELLSGTATVTFAR